MKRVLVTLLTVISMFTTARAQWTQTSGPEGGSFNSIATTWHEALAATWRGEIYRWQVSQGWNLVSSLYHPTLFAAGDTYFAISSDTLYRSTNHGASWIPTARSGSILSYSVHGTTVLVAEGNRIFRSTDGGTRWDSIGAPPLYAIGAIWANDSVMLITSGGSTDLYRSTDNGTTWSDARIGLPFGVSPFQFYSEGSTVYISMQTGVFRSSDGGATWSGINTGLPNYEGTYPIVHDMVIDNGRVYASIANGLYYFDGGVWTQTSDEANALFDKNDGVIFKASKSGVDRSENGGADWRSINAGLRAVDITALAQSGSMVVAGSSTGIYTSGDQGRTWEKRLASSIDELVDAGPALIARGWEIGTSQRPGSPGILRSLDNGATWANSSEGIGNELDNISTVASNGTTLFAGFSETFGFHGVSHWQAGGVYRSTDNGATWRLASSGLPSDGFSLVPIIDLVATDRVVVATTFAGVYRSTDNGTSWLKVNTAPPYLDGIGVMAAHEGTIYLAVGNRIFRSTDDGVNWSVVETGFEQFTSIFNMQFIGSDLMVFTNQASGFDRVFRYDGSTWENINSEFPEQAVFRSFLAVGNRLLGGTAGTSIWSSPIGTTTSVAISPAVGAGVTVHPNPFSAGTTISFEIRSRSVVKLELLDPTGRIVATLFDGPLESGRHDIRLDTADLSAGQYLYRLNIDGVISGGLVVKW